MDLRVFFPRIISLSKNSKRQKVKHPRDYTNKQNNFIREIKFRYLTTESRRRKEVYGKILSCIEFC
jgi:hypothetical protein